MRPVLYLLSPAGSRGSFWISHERGLGYDSLPVFLSEESGVEFAKIKGQGAIEVRGYLADSMGNFVNGLKVETFVLEPALIRKPRPRRIADLWSLCPEQAPEGYEPIPLDRTDLLHETKFAILEDSSGNPWCVGGLPGLSGFHLALFTSLAAARRCLPKAKPGSRIRQVRQQELGAVVNLAMSQGIEFTIVDYPTITHDYQGTVDDIWLFDARDYFPPGDTPIGN